MLLPEAMDIMNATDRASHLLGEWRRIYGEIQHSSMDLVAFYLIYCSKAISFIFIGILC